VRTVIQGFETSAHTTTDHVSRAPAGKLHRQASTVRQPTS
jgi:hypothetical protein